MTLEEMLKNDRKKIDSVGLSINRKELEYNIYLDTHRANVKYAYIKYLNVLIEALGLSENDVDKLDLRVENHDKSKYSYEEYDGYRAHFFPIDEEKGFADSAFENAWRHHYQYNDHHWEYYKTIYGCCEIPKPALAELILDWIAMSMNPSSKAYDYYEKNKDKIKLNAETRKLLEKALLAVKEYDILLGDK